MGFGVIQSAKSALVSVIMTLGDEHFHVFVYVACCIVWGLGFGVWGLGFGVWGLGFGVWGLGFGVWGLGFGVWVLHLLGHHVYITVGVTFTRCGYMTGEG